MTDLLSAHAAVAIVSPSISLSGAERIDIEAGISYLRSLGLKVKVFPQALKGTRWHPGSDEAKVADLHAAFADPEIKMIFAPHGGAGAQRLLNRLDYNLIRANPKPIVGFSDITAIQLAIYAQTGQPFVSGFLPQYDFRGGNIDSLVDTTLRQVLCGKKVTAAGGTTLHGGIVEGILLGECLSMLSDLSGTPYYPDLKDKILLLEDECEKPYKIDLMLTQLCQQPDFENLKGIIFGAFTECEATVNTHGTVDDVIADFAGRVAVPMVKNFPFGHIKSRPVLPMGVTYRFNADTGSLQQIG